MSPNTDFSPESAVEGGRIAFKLIPTVFNFPFKRIESPLKCVRAEKVRSFNLCPFYKYLTCSRIHPMIVRASR